MDAVWRFFVDFFDRHGFLNVDNRPVWQVVNGGSREYMRKLAAPLHVRLNTPVTAIRRDAGRMPVLRGG